MILKARPANGSSSEARRSPILPFSSSPLTGGISVGAGMKSITASSIACTPLFLNAEPQSIGTISLAIVRVRSPRPLVLVGLPPHGFRLRLHAADRAVDHACAIEHAHRALDLDREVDVARRVDDVDPVLGMVVVHPFPETGGRGRRDRDAALALLLHPVHDGRAVVHFAYLVRDARVEKDAFGGRGLAGINVGTDADVAIPVDGRRTCHKLHNLRKFSGDINSTGRA